jgi:hypothetical protein
MRPGSKPVRTSPGPECTRRGKREPQRPGAGGLPGRQDLYQECKDHEEAAINSVRMIRICMASAPDDAKAKVAIMASRRS